MLAAGKARAYPIGYFLLTNIRLGWKDPQGTNILANYKLNKLCPQFFITPWQPAHLQVKQVGSGRRLCRVSCLRIDQSITNLIILCLWVKPILVVKNNKAETTRVSRGRSHKTFLE